MPAPLRPMNLGEILDRTLQIYRRQFLAFACIAAIPALIVQGVSIADAFWFHMFASATKDNHYAPGLLATRMVFAIGYFHFSSFFGMLVSPSILKLISAAVLEENTTLRHALGLLVSGWKSYIWLATLKLTGELFLPEMLAFWLFAATM